MVTQRQLKRLFNEFKKKGNMSHSAMKSDLDRKTAAKYLGQNCQSPEELQARHTWRTREDPLAGVWEQAGQMLQDAPELESKALFEHLLLGNEGALTESHWRTFQRRVKQWRLSYGPDQGVFFAQDRTPGKTMQLDWTHALEAWWKRSSSPRPSPPFHGGEGVPSRVLRGQCADAPRGVSPSRAAMEKLGLLA